MKLVAHLHCVQCCVRPTFSLFTVICRSCMLGSYSLLPLLYILRYLQVYFDFMRSFRVEFDDLFGEGLISAVEIGLGPSGELKYPSFSHRMGWRYPGIGEFQVSYKLSLYFPLH